MVELELLAIAWSCEKARPFVEGIKFEIYTDHRPLIPILNDYALSEIENKRLQRLKMKLSGFTFEAHWIDGKANVEADALSRAPVHQAKPEDELDEEFETLTTSLEALHHLNLPEEIDFAYVETMEVYINDKLNEDVREAGESDVDYKQVKAWLMDRYQPHPDTIKPNVAPYYRQLDRFSLDGSNLLCYDDRLVIPEGLRSRYLDHLVRLHASPAKMKSRARKTIWWPHMSTDIDQKWRSCRSCVDRSPSNKTEPSRPRDPANYPFQKLHMDLGSYNGRNFLIVIDQFSLWPIVRNMGKHTESAAINDSLLTIFETFGLPEEIYTDGGPQFTSQEFDDFCASWCIRNTTSSPHHPQSNGIAENGVKAMKRLIHCTFDDNKNTVDKDEWLKAITLYKNTPRGPSNTSPAEILFGRILRDGIPASQEHFVPKHKAAADRRRDEVNRYFSGLEDVKGPIFVPGDKVYIQDPISKRWTHEGVIDCQAKTDRDFWITTTKGARWRRNRRFLKHQDIRKNKGGSKYIERRKNPSQTPPTPPISTPMPSQQATTTPKPSPTFIEPRRSTRDRREPERFSAGAKKKKKFGKKKVGRPPKSSPKPI